MAVLSFGLITMFFLLGLDADMTGLRRTSVNRWLFKRQADECLGSEYYLCKSGECLTKYQLCDSFIDCADKSDEAAVVCKALYKGRCQRGQWRCAYGACLEESQHCDEKMDCWDGSDEADCPDRSSTTNVQQTPVTPRPQPPSHSNKPCVVPMDQNTQFYSWSIPIVRRWPGYLMPNNGPLLITCDSEQNLVLEEGKQNFSICNNGEWAPKIPRCTACGLTILNKNRPATFVNGQDGEPGYFPWFAGIYQWHENQWKRICAGALISSRVVLTAAHCVSYTSTEVKVPVPITKEDLGISLGKYHCNWNTFETTQQRFEVIDVIFHPGYRTGINMSNDIALLLLDRTAELNAFVMPACVDFTNTYTRDLTDDKSLLGHVAGWTDFKDWKCLLPNASIRLRYSSLPVVARHDLYDLFKATKKSAVKYIYEDLFAVSNGSDADIFAGNFGGGLTIPFDNRHYIFGILIKKLTFNRVVYGTYINVTHHIDWLREIMDIWS